MSEERGNFGVPKSGLAEVVEAVGDGGNGTGDDREYIQNRGSEPWKALQRA